MLAKRIETRDPGGSPLKAFICKTRWNRRSSQDFEKNILTTKRMQNTMYLIQEGGESWSAQFLSLRVLSSFQHRTISAEAVASVAKILSTYSQSSF